MLPCNENVGSLLQGGASVSKATSEKLACADTNDGPWLRIGMGTRGHGHEAQLLWKTWASLFTTGTYSVTFYLNLCELF